MVESGKEAPSIDPNLVGTLEKFIQEPGMLALDLFSSSRLTDEWVELSLSWKNVNLIVVRDFFSKPVFKFLENMLRQEGESCEIRGLL
ncbi:hypothetical protein L596_017601 [Steinernema carpocapsae]|uniref:Uncharacterized protein n=1 Tax=Steinernema carpocapsae TaxID=34508 RepID=A0A4U5N2E5_STECR|nr:hypothetical protein L596_017601 [Steinernema carpocapsae]